MKKLQQTTKDFVGTLEEMGCPYEIDSDHSIKFNYKNYQFIAMALPEIPVVIVVDTDPEVIDLEDLDEVLRMRKAMNVANQLTLISTFYRIDEKEKKMHVSGKHCFFFDSCITYRSDYLRYILDEFIDTRRLLTLEMEKLRAEDEA